MTQRKQQLDKQRRQSNDTESGTLCTKKKIFANRQDFNVEETYNVTPALKFHYLPVCPVQHSSEYKFQQCQD